jgi:hypothetical protein
MAYTVDLTTVLKSLFESMITPAQPPQSSGITWSELKEAFDVYKDKGSLERIHHRFYDIFQHDQQILGSEDSFRGMFNELLKDERQGTGALITSIRTSVYISVFRPTNTRTPTKDRTSAQNKSHTRVRI